MADLRLSDHPGVMTPPGGDIPVPLWRKFAFALNDLVALKYPKVYTFTSTDATPSVKGGHVFLTAGTTAITDFDDGVVGQTIKVLAMASITITDGSPIILNGSANYTMTVTDVLVLTMFNDQVWSEVSRSVN